MSERIAGILQQIQSDLRKWNSSKLIAFVKEQSPPLNDKERLELLDGLCSRNIFLWLDYISAELKSLASLDPHYLGILAYVVGKVRQDMAQGPIIQALMSIGEDDPKLGIGLSSVMRQKGDEGLTIYSSFPLGGAGRKDLDAIRPILEGLMRSANPTDVTAALRTYRVVYENAEKIPAEIFRLMETYATDKELSVKLEAFNALIDFAKSDEQKAVNVLTNLAKEDSSLHGAIATRLHMRNLFSPKSTLALLQIIMQNEDDRILGEVMSVLAFQGAKFQQEALEMVISLVARGKYHKVHLLDYAAEQVGKVDIDTAVKTLATALKAPHAASLDSFAPYLLVDMCKSDYVALASHLKSWLGDEQLRKTALSSSRELLGLAFETNNQNVANMLYPVLESDAKAAGINVERLLKRDNDKVAQCIELLEEIRLPRKPLEYAEIERNWPKFPSLREFLGDRWLSEKETEGNNTHYILYNLAFLSREAELEKAWSEPLDQIDPFKAFLRSLWIQDLLRPRAMLTYLEEMTASVKEMQGNHDLKSGLRSDEQFFQTFSELQIAYAFARRSYPLVIGPSIGTKKLDLEVTLDGSRILFEVINPDMFRPLKYATRAVGVPNRARDKIYEEFKKHLAQKAGDEIRPVIIVIDLGRSEIDYDFVEDYLYGTQQYTWWTDKKTGKIVAEGPTRAQDSMHKLGETSSEKLDIISAVICYKTPMGNDGRLHMQGQILINPHAHNPLADEQISRIDEAMFY
jgi:hypothetical protein